MTNHKGSHSDYLEALSSHSALEAIGEDKRDIEVIFYEPIWLIKGYQAKAPDMLIKKTDGTWLVIELKGHRKKRTKAIHQIENGKELLHKVFHIPLRDILGKFVVYSNKGRKKGYTFEIV